MIRRASAALLLLTACTESARPTPPAAPAAPPEPPPLAWRPARPALAAATLRHRLPSTTELAVALSPDLATATSSTATLLGWTQGLLDLPDCPLELSPGAPVLLARVSGAWLAWLPVPDPKAALVGLGATRLDGIEGALTSPHTPDHAWFRDGDGLALSRRIDARSTARALRGPRGVDALDPLLGALAFGGLAAGYVAPQSSGPLGAAAFGLDLTEEHLLTKVVVQTSSAARGGPALDLAALPWTDTATPALFAAARASPDWIAKIAAGIVAREGFEGALAAPAWRDPGGLRGGLVTAWRGPRYGRALALEVHDPAAATATTARPLSPVGVEGPWAKLGHPRRGGRPLWASWSDARARLLPRGDREIFVVARPAALWRDNPFRAMLARDVDIMGALLFGAGGKGAARLRDELSKTRRARRELRGDIRSRRRGARDDALAALGPFVASGTLVGGHLTLYGGFAPDAAPQDHLRIAYRILRGSRTSQAESARGAELDATMARLERRAERLRKRHFRSMLGAFRDADIASLVGEVDAHTKSFSSLAFQGSQVGAIGSAGAVGLIGGRPKGQGGGGLGTGRLGSLGTKRARYRLGLSGGPPALERHLARKRARIERCLRRLAGSAEGLVGTSKLSLRVGEGGGTSVESITGPAAKARGCLQRALRGRVEEVATGAHVVELRYERR